MEMVAVRRIVIGRQHCRVEPAGTVAHVAKKAAAGAVIAPVAGDADPGAVGQGEAGDVDRVRPRMLAPHALVAAVEPPAAVASEMLDARHLAAEMRLRGRLHDMPFP